MSEKTDSPATSTAGVIHQLQHAARRYRIITADEEIIEQTGEQIVRACQLQISVAAWRQNFGLMIEHVAQWCETRKEKVALALVHLRPDKIRVYLVPRSEHYDFDLADEQGELDIYLNTRGGMGYAESRQVPAWDIERFVPPDAYRLWPTES